MVNCAGVYEPPTSSFWNPPGISPLAEDPEDAEVGQYKTFSINTIGPIRLAQIAVDYWQQHPEVQGNLLFVASMGGYLHSMQTPLYFASKAALVSMVKSLAGLKTALGIRNAAICPGAVFVSLINLNFSQDMLIVLYRHLFSIRSIAAIDLKAMMLHWRRSMLPGWP